MEWESHRTSAKKRTARVLACFVACASVAALMLLPDKAQAQDRPFLRKLLERRGEAASVPATGIQLIERSFPGVVEGLADVSPVANGIPLATAPARWVEGDDARAIPYVIDTSVAVTGFSQDDLVAAIEKGFAAWSEATGLLFRFEGFETFDRAASDYANLDGRIRVQMHDSYNVIDTVTGVEGSFHQVGEGGFKGSSQSFGNSAKGPGNGGRLGTQEFYRIYNGWVVLNHREATRIGSQGVLESVIAHEIGHALGFEHSSEIVGETRTEFREAIMYRFVHEDGRGAQLGDWDRQTAEKIYPLNNTPPAGTERLFFDLTSYNPVLHTLQNPEVNSFTIKGRDLQSEPTELTVEVDNVGTINGVFTDGRTFGQFLPVTAGGLVVWDSLLRFAADRRYSPDGLSQLVFRISDGTNASPWSSLDGISYNRETMPSSLIDGIPDSWIDTHYTSRGIPFQGADHDTDGDGINDLDEYLQRTDPNSSASNVVVSFADPEQCAPLEAGAVITIKLQTNITTQRPLDLPFTITGNLTEGTDFVFAPKVGGSIRIDPLNIGDPDRPGTTESEIRIRLAESLSPGDKMLTLSIQDPGGLALIDATKDTHTILLVDSESAEPEVRFANASYTIDEGSAAASKTLTLTRAFSCSPTTVRVTLAGTGATPAVEGVDYSGGTFDLSFAGGQTEANFSLSLLGNTLRQGDRQLEMTLSVIGGLGTVLAADETVALTIRDDDPVPSLSLSDASASEASGPMTFTAQLSNATTEAVSFSVSTSNGSATAGQDFTALSSQRFSIPGGDTSYSFQVILSDDAATEGDETFAVILSSPENASLGTKVSATGVIVDNEVPLVIPSVTVQSSDNSAIEGIDTAEFTLTLSPESPATTTVQIQFQGTASPSDYATLAQNVTFPPGSTQQKIVITPLTDTNPDETTETVILRLVAGNGYTLGAASSASINIVPNSVYDNWARSTGVQGRPEDDDDRDCISNAAEYALQGMHPLQVNSLPPITINGREVSWTICWNPVALAAGVSPVIEASTDMERWRLAEDNGFRLSTAGNCTTVLSSTNFSKFLRVRVRFSAP